MSVADDSEVQKFTMAEALEELFRNEFKVWDNGFILGHADLKEIMERLG